MGEFREGMTVGIRNEYPDLTASLDGHRDLLPPAVTDSVRNWESGEMNGLANLYIAIDHLEMLEKQ